MFSKVFRSGFSRMLQTRLFITATAAALCISGASDLTAQSSNYLNQWPLETDASDKVAIMDFLDWPDNKDLRPIFPGNLPDNEIITTITTIDDHILEVTYAHTPVTPDAPLVVLFPDQNEQRSDFEDFAKALRRQGLSTLTVDFRGFGGSTRKADGTEFLASSFQSSTDNTHFKDMVYDVEAVLDWVDEMNLADEQGVYLFGSVMGATMSALAGIPNATRLEGIVLVSPQINFRRINLSEIAGQIQGLPIVAMIGENDTYRRTTPRMLNNINNEIKPVLIPGSDFGIKLLRRPESVQETVNFIEKVEADRQEEMAEN